MIIKNIRCSIITIVLICAATTLHAQQWKEEVKELILRRHPPRHLTAASDQWTAEETREAVRFARGFIRDSSYQVRLKVLEISHEIAMGTADSAVRQLAVHVLLQPLSTKDHELTHTSLSLLTTFKSGDFSPYARDTIRYLIRDRGLNMNPLLKLAGFLGLKDLAAQLQTYTQTGHPSSTRWNAMLSLARLGNEMAIEDILRRVERAGVSDEVVYNVFPDLIYTRHPRAIAFLARQLQNEEKNCFTADAEREVPIPCAYRILEQLATVIEHFPIEVDSSGDIKTDNYPAALAMAREWFVKHPSYGIHNDEF